MDEINFCWQKVGDELFLPAPNWCPYKIGFVRYRQYGLPHIIRVSHSNSIPEKEKCGIVWFQQTRR